MKRTNFTILGSCLIFMLAAGAGEYARRDISPHAIALALILEKESARIAALETDDNGGRWLDTGVREWRVQRPVGPGFMNTTEFFSVTYLVDGEQRAHWNVNTKRMTFAREGESIQID